MAAIVSLRDVAGNMDICPEGGTCYLNRQSGEFVHVTEDSVQIAEKEDDEIDADEPEWMADERKLIREVLSSDDWLALPSKFDIHEYKIMEQFAASRQDEDIREQLLDAIRASGAFRRFKNLVRRLGIDETWYRYKEEALQAIARDWLEAQGIEYTE
jgi:hypothetical protein